MWRLKEHDIRVVLVFLRNYSSLYSQGSHAEVSTRFARYNSMEGEVLPYSGLLPGVCIWPNRTLSVLAVEALRNCKIAINTTESFEDVNKVNGTLSLQFKDPQGSNQMKVMEISSTNVKGCAQNTINENESKNSSNIINAVLFLIGGLFIIGLNIGVSIWACRRRRRTQRSRSLVREEGGGNPIYGLYYTAEGDRIDESTVEVVDSNGYYGVSPR